MGNRKGLLCPVPIKPPDPLWISDDLLAVRGEQLPAWVREGSIRPSASRQV